MAPASEAGQRSWPTGPLSCGAVLLLLSLGACQRGSPADGKADFSSTSPPSAAASHTTASSPLCGSAQDAALAQCQTATQTVSTLGKAATLSSNATLSAAPVQ